MRFAAPLYFLLLAPVAALVWLELHKRTASVRFSDASFFRVRQGPGRYLKPAILAVQAAALVLAVLALARPQRGRVLEEIESRGVDIMLCMDVSESMSTRRNSGPSSSSPSVPGTASGSSSSPTAP